MARISSEALSILKSAECSSTQVKLPVAKLERALYLEVNEVLDRLGGKWKGGKTSAHLFPFDVSEQLQAVVETGLLPPKNPDAFFPTPSWVIDQMIDHAGDLSNCTVLEPSAGLGAIADRIMKSYPSAKLDMVECNSFRADVLRKKGYEVAENDFMSITSAITYDCILMNPPFSVATDKTAYISHILHAYDLLVEGGKLVAIAPTSFLSRTDKRHIAFKELVGGNYQELGKGVFKESGTAVETVLLWLVKDSN